MIEQGSYLNMPNEEWAVRIMINLLINQGLLPYLDEKRREEYLMLQNAYLLH